MADKGGGLLRRLLANAVAFEQSGEQRWREFAATTGDDDEVRSLFEEGAASAILNGQRMGVRLAELGRLEDPDTGHFAAAFESASQVGQTARAPEEYLLHNLVLASAMKAECCALYRSVAIAAATAGDRQTEVLARDIGENEQNGLEKLRHLLPSRSKIAFNMLTVSEIDPAVETKAKDDRPGS